MSIQKLSKAAFTFGDIIAAARKGGEDTVPPRQKKPRAEKKLDNERTHTLPPIQELPSITDLQRFSRALQEGTAFRSDTYRPNYNSHPASPYQPERPHLPRAALRPTNAAQLGSIFVAKKAPLRRENHSSVSFCDHQEFYIAWETNDPGNHNGSYKPHMERFEDRSPWEQHKNCLPPELPSCFKKLAKKIIGKFEHMENGRLSYFDIKEGKSPCRAPPLQRIEREVRNMYSQMFRGKYDDIVEKKESLRINLDAKSRRKEEIEQIKMQAQFERQRNGIAKGQDVDDLEDDVPVVKQQTKKMAKQIAEEKAQKDAAVTPKTSAEPAGRFKIKKKDKIAFTTTSPSTGKKITKLVSQTPTTPNPNAKKHKEPPTGDDATATTTATKKRKPARSTAIIENSDKEADYSLPEAPPVPTNLSEEVVSAPIRSEWTVAAEELVKEIHYYEEERKIAVEKHTEPITAPASATSNLLATSTSEKRKRNAIHKEDEDDNIASPTAESSSRPIKKAKKMDSSAKAKSRSAPTRRNSMLSLDLEPRPHFASSATVRKPMAVSDANVPRVTKKPAKTKGKTKLQQLLSRGNR